MESVARHLLSLDDLPDAALHAIVQRGTHLAVSGLGAERPLRDKVVGTYFRKTSTRTRVAFSGAALRLGAQVITLGPGDLQTNTGESWQDTGDVLSRMLDAIVVRTAADPAELREWTGQRTMSVINAMTSDEHPTQALADLATLRQHFARISGLRLLYVGEGNNTAAALALALARYPDVMLEFRTPPGYGVDPGVWERALTHAKRCGATLAERHDLDDLPPGCDVIYTTRWQTTGSVKPDANWRRTFAPFQVTGAMWERSPDSVFMHDLPAHRGEEVTAEVLDGPRSIALRQAENKMHSAMAVLEWCFGALGEEPLAK
ncbi:ornithine carbamoyltransferase [Nonomuraea sp. NPDC052116]|uniref:ornithine carbamoyltransferase n=1 Tax=Nonomuraea sp. NPDC052116 TaxID=3155665 RepID=UPI00341D9354